MILSTLLLSILGLLGVGFFSWKLLKHFKLINFHNLNIFIVLFGFWTIVGIAREYFFQQNVFAWEYAIIVATSFFVQSFFRLSFGVVVEKMQSRRLVFILAFSIFCVLAIPFLVESSYATLLVLGIGVAAFASTFGIQDQYFLENWDRKRIFSTIAILWPLPMLGVFAFNIFENALQLGGLELSKTAITWIMLALIGPSIILSTFFLFGVREMSHIWLPNNTTGEVSTRRPFEFITLKDLILMSLTGALATLGAQMILQQNFIFDLDWRNFLQILITITTIIIGLAIALVIIRFVNVTNLIIFSSIGLIATVGLALILSLLNYNFLAINISISILISAFLAINEISYFGLMLSLDQKSRFWVLGIFLIFRSLATSIGFGMTKATLRLENLDFYVWISLGAFLAVLLAFILFLWWKKRYKIVLNLCHNYNETISQTTALQRLD